MMRLFLVSALVATSMTSAQMTTEWLEDAITDIIPPEIEGQQPGVAFTFGDKGKKNMEDFLLKKINGVVEKLTPEQKNEILKESMKGKSDNIDISDSQTFSNFVERELQEENINIVGEEETTSRRSLASDQFTLATMNAYWKGVVYGEKPGPCPDFANRCSGLACNMQQYLYDLAVLGGTTIGDIIVHQVTPQSACSKQFTDRLIGLNDIWEVECKFISIQGMKLSVVPSSTPNNHAIMEFQMVSLRMACKMKIAFHYLGIKLLGYDAATGKAKGEFRLPLGLYCYANPMQSDLMQVSFDATSMSARGMSMTMRLGFRPKTGTWATELPYTADFEPTSQSTSNSADNGCRFSDLDFSLQIPSAQVCCQGSRFCSSQNWGLKCMNLSEGGLTAQLFNTVMNAILGLIKSFMAGLICNIMVQFAWLNNDKSKPGAINQGLQYVWDLLNGYKTGKTLRGGADWHRLEKERIAKHPLILTNSVDFSSSSIVEAISLGLNKVLGSKSTTPGYTNTLGINELVDVALGRKDGIFDVRDLKTKLNWADYPTFDWCCGSAVFDGNMKVVSIMMSGLNSFSALRIMDNGYADPEDFAAKYGPRFKYSFVNDIKLDLFSMDMVFTIHLEDGVWVNLRDQSQQPQKKTIDWSLRMSMQITKMNFLVVPLVGFIPDAFLSLQFGQLMGNVSSFVYILNCVATTFEDLQLNSFASSIGEPGKPGIVSFVLQSTEYAPGDLTDMMTKGVQLFKILYAQAMSVYLPYITEFGIRPMINQAIDDAYIPENRNCDNTLPIQVFKYQNPNECYIDFYNSNAMLAGFSVVNNVIGGNPITISVGDINSIIELYLNYYLPALKPSTVIEMYTKGNYTFVQVNNSKPVDVNFFNGKRRMAMKNVTIMNLNSIHDMRLKQVNQYGNNQTINFRMVMGDGRLLNTQQNPYKLDYRGPIGVSAIFDAFVEIPTHVPNAIMANDYFKFNMGFGNFTIDADITLFLNFTKILFLRQKDLMSPACLMAITDQHKIEKLDIGFKTLVYSFELDPTRTSCPSPGNPAQCSKLRSAINKMNQPVSATARQAITYLFQGVSEMLKQSFNNYVFYGNIEDCAGAPSPFTASLLLNIASAMYSVTSFADIYNYFVVDSVSKYVPMPPRDDGYVKVCGSQINQDFINDCKIQKGANFLNIRDNEIRTQIHDMVSGKDTFKQFLRDAADRDWKALFAEVDISSALGPEYAGYANTALIVLDSLVYLPAGSGKVNLVLPFSKFGFEDQENDFYAPGLVLKFGVLTVENIDQISTWEFMGTYEQDIFTTVYNLTYEAPISIAFSIIMTVDERWHDITKTTGLLPNIPANNIGLITPAETYHLRKANRKLLTDTISFNMVIKDFTFSSRLVSAVNMDMVNQIPLGNWIQIRKDTLCVGQIFYPGGLNLTVLWLDMSVEVFQFQQAPNGLLNEGLFEFIFAVMEILLVMAQNDLKSAFHNGVRGNINTNWNAWIEESLFKAECPPTQFWSPPWLDFMDQQYVYPQLDLLNTKIGGNPVNNGFVSVNNMFELIMNYTLANGYLDQYITLEHPKRGEWKIPSVATSTSLTVSNMVVSNVDSIHVLTAYPNPKTIPSYGLDFDIKIGGNGIKGLIYDNKTGTYLIPGKFIMQVEIDTNVKVVRKGQTYTYSNEKFVFKIAMYNMSFDVSPDILFNMNTLYNLKLYELSSTKCIIACVENLKVRKFELKFDELSVFFDDSIAPVNRKFNRLCPTGTYPKKCMWSALSTLEGELNSNNHVLSTKTMRMLNIMLGNVPGNVPGLSGAVIAAAGMFDPSANSKVDCAVPQMLLTIVGGVNSPAEADALIFAVRKIVGVVSTSVAVPFNALTGTYDTLQVQSDRVDSDRSELIRDLEAAAATAKGTATGAASNPIQLTARGPCANYPGISGSPLENTCSWFVLNQGNLTKGFSDSLAEQINLVDAGVPADILESQVKIGPNNRYFDVRESTIVSGISGFFGENTAATVGQTLRDYVIENPSENMKVVGGELILSANMNTAVEFIDTNLLVGVNCFGQSAPSFKLADLLVETDAFLPRFSVKLGNFTIKNVDMLQEVMILAPYPKAKFTTRHVVSYRGAAKPLAMSMSLTFQVDKSFIDAASPLGAAYVSETVDFSMTLSDLYMDILFLLAVDTDYLGKLSLGDFIGVDSQHHANWTGYGGKPPADAPIGIQNFTRNCYAVTCLMTSIYPNGFALPQLWMNMTDAAPSIVTSGTLFSQGVQAVSNAMMEMGTQLFVDSLAALMNGPVRTSVNQLMASTVNDAKNGACPKKFNYTTDYPKYISKLNFQNSQNLRDLNVWIRSNLLNSSSVFYINNIIGQFASVETGWTELNGIPVSYGGSSYGTVSLGIGRFILKGVNTINRLVLFDTLPWAPGGSEGYRRELDQLAEAEAVEKALDDEAEEEDVKFDRRQLVAQNWSAIERQYLSRTEFGMGYLPGQAPFEIGFDLKMAFDGLFKETKENAANKGVIKNHLRMALLLYGLESTVDLFMLINIPRLMDLQIQSVSTIWQLPCILAIFDNQGLMPFNFNLTFSGISFKLSCEGECTSKSFQPLMGGALDSNSQASVTKGVTDAVNGVVSFLVTYIASTSAQQAIDQQIDAAISNCQAIQANIAFPDIPPLKEEKVAMLMGIAGLAGVFSACCAFACLIPVHYRRRGDHLKAHLLAGGMSAQNMKSRDEFDLADRKLKSAFEHPAMNRAVKYLVPVMIIVNIIMFVTGNFFAKGAVVEMTLTLGGDKTKPLSLLPFTLESSIDDMWSAGTYGLAIIIAVFSGAWPYAKNITLLFCWFAPATVLAAKTRKNTLEVLDALGKWSLIDLFVLIMLMVAFRFYLTSSYVAQLSALPPEFIAVDVRVSPQWGIFGFMFGCIGSLLVNHLMIWHNKKIMDADEELDDAIKGVLVKDISTPRIPLWTHKFAVTDAQGNSYRYAVSWRVSIVALVGMSIMFIIVGSALPLMTFDFKGVAGLAIAFIDSSKATTKASLFTICTGLIEGVSNDNATDVAGVVLLQIFFLLFSFVMPVLACASLIVLFTVPLTLREQTLMRFACEVMYAWEALPVFVLSVIAAILQISQLAQFIVQNNTGSYCSALEVPLQSLFPADKSDAKCFDVVANVLPSGAILLTASVAQLIGCAITWRMVDAALLDRTLAMKRKIPVSPGELTGLEGFVVRRALEPFANRNMQQQQAPMMTAGAPGQFMPASMGMMPAGISMQQQPMYGNFPSMSGAPQQQSRAQSVVSTQTGHYSIDV